MRLAASPRRNNDSFAKMLAAVAAASFATIRGPPAMKPPTPATMQSNHKPPAILARRTGDSSLKCSVISDLLIVVPSDSYAAIRCFEATTLGALPEVVGARDSRWQKHAEHRRDISQEGVAQKVGSDNCRLSNSFGDNPVSFTPGFRSLSEKSNLSV